MTIRIGINGLGRIGRSILRASLSDPAFAGLSIVAVNDPAPTRVLAHLLKYDSVMGVMKGSIAGEGGHLIVNDREISHFQEAAPALVPWRQASVEWVIEASGRFASRDGGEAHLTAGARKVVITAPAKGDVKTFVMGINEDEYDPTRHHVVSNASCTTNCLAPVAKVVDDRFGIESGVITTIHAYTNDQRLLDSPHNDLRRARAAALSMIPTTTGAASAIGLVMPHLRGLMDGLSVRVPTANVSLVDASFHLRTPTNTDGLNAALEESQDRYLGFTREPLVSVDLAGDPRSAIVDGESTRVLGDLAKVLIWYDNEWGYANRVLDLILHMAARE